MGYIPKNTEWFVAELVMEITVDGAYQNAVHRDMILVRANTSEEAYQRALYWGHEGETSYENPGGRTVTIRFKGISKLDAVVDKLADGAELTFEEIKGVSSEEIARWVPPKERLEAFKPPRLFSKQTDPDYSSGAVLERMAEAGLVPDQNKK